MALTNRERSIVARTYVRNIYLESYDARIAYAKQVSRLMRISRKLDRINEDRCNGFHNPEHEAATDKLEPRLEEQARTICKDLGITLHINGDPRGAALKISLNQAEWRSSSDDVDYLGMDTDLLY